jgi:hypothetical protein
MGVLRNIFLEKKSVDDVLRVGRRTKNGCSKYFIPTYNVMKYLCI